VRIADCSREQDVLDALTSGCWPDRAGDDLRTHVATCGYCADLADVAGALLEDRPSDRADARIPSSAVMWWRAQMRARQEAAREAARPITVAHVVALVTVMALTVTALVALSPWFARLLRGWVAVVADAAGAVQAPSGLLAQGWVLPALIIGVWLVLAPVAIYLVVADD
jgi:hypothetical protein